MAWSAALGLAGSAFGAISASNTAKAQMAQQQYQFDKQMEMQGIQVGMALDAQRQQIEENAYQRQIEQMNRLMAQQERDFQRESQERYREDLMDERRQVIERQIEEDKEAAKQRQFYLEQLLQNQDLKQEERDFAVQQLEEVKSIAAGERDEDKRRFLEEREMAKIERDFVIGEYEDFKTQAQLERDEDLRIREEILAQVSGMQDALSGAQSQLGYVPEIPQLTEDAIAREIAKRESQYVGDVDRAIEQVASVNEADLIRRGLDESTPGTARRGEIAARAANEYTDARRRAYDDALKYITGKTSAMSTNVNDIMNRRKAILGEVQGVEGAGLDAMMRLPQAASATGAYRMASALPSGIYNRQISSANDFRAPVSIGSGIYDSINVPSGLANYRVPTSAAVNLASGVGSAIYNPLAVSIDSPQNYMNNASTIGNQLLSNATSSANNAYDRSYDASSGFGKSVFDFMGTAPEKGGKTYGAQFDDFMSGLFKGSG